MLLRLLLIFSAVFCVTQTQNTYYIGEGTAMWGLVYIYTDEPVVSVNSTSFVFPMNSTGHTWFARIHDDAVTGELVEAVFFPTSCTLRNPDELAGKIAIYRPNWGNRTRPCYDFQEPTAAFVQIQGAGAVGMIMEDDFITDSPRDPMWRQVEGATAVAIFVDGNTTAKLLTHMQEMRVAGTPLFATISPMNEEIRAAAALYATSERAISYGIPVLSAIVVALSAVTLALRAIREGNCFLRSSNQNKLLRLCLWFIILAGIERIVERGVDHGGKYGRLADGVSETISSFGYGFDFSAILLVVAMWLLVISWNNRIITPIRIFRITLITIILVHVLLALLGVLQTGVVSNYIILVMILILVLIYAVVGAVFLRNLCRTTAFARKRNMQDKVSRKLYVVQLRMTVLLFGVVISAVLIFCLYMADTILSNWPPGHIFVPFFTDLCRLAAEAFVIAALFVTPERRKGKSGSSGGSRSGSQEESISSSMITYPASSATRGASVSEV